MIRYARSERHSAASWRTLTYIALAGACSANSARPSGSQPETDGTGGSAGSVGTIGGMGGPMSSGGVAGAMSSGGGAGTSAGASDDAGSSAAGSSPVDAGASGAGGRASSSDASIGRVDANGNGGVEASAARGATGAEAGGTTTANGCPIKLEGWATVNADGVNGTTGGGNRAPTTVTTFAQLQAAAADPNPRVVVVSGTINTTDGGGFALPITSNKTIVGADKTATIYGGLTVSNATNVIIRNLNIHGVWPNSGPDDTLASHNSTHVWFDHLNVWDAGDGELDITNESNYETVSWSKFWYTNAAHPHRLASLNGSGAGDHPEDAGKLKVTYHHNWWSDLVNERMPRVVYGQGHQYNNYFNSPGDLYCIGVGSFGAILVENNYFKDVRSPHQFMYALPMSITARGNVYNNTTGSQDNGPGGTGTAVEPFTNPPYSYTMDDAATVPSIVTRCAGPQ